MVRKVIGNLVTGNLIFSRSLLRDGLSKTFLVGERASRLGPSVWIGSIAGVDESMARVVGPTDHPPNHVEEHFDDFSSHHPTGAYFVMCDGST